MHMPILAITPPTGRSRTERPSHITGEHGDVFDQDQSIATRWTELVSAQSLKKRRADECEVCTGNELVRVGGLRASLIVLGLAWSVRPHDLMKWCSAVHRQSCASARGEN
jgi:hypothetical protein